MSYRRCPKQTEVPNHNSQLKVRWIKYWSKVLWLNKASIARVKIQRPVLTNSFILERRTRWASATECKSKWCSKRRWPTRNNYQTPVMAVKEIKRRKTITTIRGHQLLMGKGNIRLAVWFKIAIRMAKFSNILTEPQCQIISYRPISLVEI